jgi:ankyrin repeat protein
LYELTTVPAAAGGAEEPTWTQIEHPVTRPNQGVIGNSLTKHLQLSPLGLGVGGGWRAVRRPPAMFTTLRMHSDFMSERLLIAEREERQRQAEELMRMAPLDVYGAVTRGSAEQLRVVEFPFEELKEVDEEGMAPLHYAVDACNIAAVRWLLRNNVPIDPVDRIGRTPLFIACTFGIPIIVRRLIKAGARVDHADEDGRTSLYSSVYHNHYECTKLLLDSRANPGKTDVQGTTPLFFASVGCAYECVQLLLEYGSPINAMKDDGSTALIPSIVNGDSASVKLLVEAKVTRLHAACRLQ